MTPEIKERIDKIQRGEVPEGYKKTKTGIVPADWSVTNVGHCVKEYREISNDIANIPIYSSSRKGLMPQSDYYDGKEAVETNIGYKVVPQGFVTYRHMSDDDIFHFNINNSRSEVLVSSEYPVFTASPNADLGYIIPVLNNTSRFRYFCRTQKLGGTRTRLYFKNLSKYALAVPKLEEQQKIAEILTTQDRVIELKEKLIAEKQRQKKYLMQQLLTGKKRLPGFSGEWETHKFSDIFNFIPTNTLSRADLCYETGEVKNIHYGDVLIKFPEILRVNQACIPYIAEGKEPAKCVCLQNGDVVVADTAEDMTVGKATEVQEICSEKIVSGLHTMCLRPEQGLFSAGWLGYYINSMEFHGQLMRLACGSKVSSISKNAIKDTILRVPCRKEQTTIVDILSTADREIELLQQDLEQEKQKKKALMQLLLTGIVRVKI